MKNTSIEKFKDGKDELRSFLKEVNLSEDTVILDSDDGTSYIVMELNAYNKKRENQGLTLSINNKAQIVFKKIINNLSNHDFREKYHGKDEVIAYLKEEDGGHTRLFRIPLKREGTLDLIIDRAGMAYTDGKVYLNDFGEPINGNKRMESVEIPTFEEYAKYYQYDKSVIEGRDKLISNVSSNKEYEYIE